MNLSAAFIHRPIATALLMVAIVLLGIIGYELLPVAALPDVDSPTIQVTAQLPVRIPRRWRPPSPPNSSASSVISSLTRWSSSALGYTQITLQFGRDRTVDSAAQDVQAAINASVGMPLLLNPPIYRKPIQPTRRSCSSR